MSHFRKLRLIPEFLYERLKQDREPMTVDYGDTRSHLNITVSENLAKLLTDTSRPLEDRVRLFNQKILRQIINKQGSSSNINEGDDGGGGVGNQDKKSED